MHEASAAYKRGDYGSTVQLCQAVRGVMGVEEGRERRWQAADCLRRRAPPPCPHARLLTLATAASA